MRDVPFDDPKWEQFIDQLTLDDMVGAVDEYFGTKLLKQYLSQRLALRMALAVFLAPISRIRARSPE